MRGRIPGRDEEPLSPVIERYGLDLNRWILELGPGNGQLRPLVEAAGGMYVGVDKDPLAGEHVLDYEMTPSGLPRHLYGGVFCRNSIAAHWANLPLLAREIHVRMAYDSWGWIALWTGDCQTTLDVVAAIKVFGAYGYVADRDYNRTNQVLVTRGL